MPRVRGEITGVRHTATFENLALARADRKKPPTFEDASLKFRVHFMARTYFRVSGYLAADDALGEPITERGHSCPHECGARRMLADLIEVFFMAVFATAILMLLMRLHPDDGE
jgi:hypothetical protein